MRSEPEDVFAGLAPAWRACFQLAWESFQAGSIPIGAVLVDGAGDVVAAGRNLWNERDHPPGTIGGSNLAHAEINALIALPPGDYPDHVLYSTLEPCVLCTAALRHSHVGTTRFAAPDPMWAGIAELLMLHEHMARRWARREGPIGGPLETWAALLPLISAVERGITSVQQCHADASPALLRLAREWAGGRAEVLRRMDLEEAFAASRPDLVAI